MGPPSGGCVMARFTTVTAATTGIYGFLVEMYEADFDDWQANKQHAHARGAPYPRRRILEALRSGQPANVPTDWLPDWAQLGAPTRKGRLGLATITPARAIVRPDDTIGWSDDNAAALWLEENDL